MRFSLIYISSYLIVCESAFTFLGIFSLMGFALRSPLMAIVLLLWLATIVINWLAMRMSRNFTFFFYHSGHWKKLMADYLQLRDHENDPPPDFKRLKIVLALSAVLSAFLTLGMLGAVIGLMSGKGIGEGIMLLIALIILRGGQAFYLYWTWRGINFVTKYADVDPSIMI